MSTQKKQIEELVSLVTEIATGLKETNNKLELLEKRVKVKEEEPKVTPQSVSVTVSQVAPSVSYPVPSEYRDIVDVTLNQTFGLEVIPMSDRPMFEFAILVPKEYSNAGEPHWQTYKADRRPRLISFAEGVNGVRDWTQRVFNNLDQETRTKISLDRAQLKR